MKKILASSSCDLTTSKDQILNDRNKIAIERQVNNCDLRIDRNMCTFVIMYKYIYISPSTLIFENLGDGGCTPYVPPSKSTSAEDMSNLQSFIGYADGPIRSKKPPIKTKNLKKIIQRNSD